MTEAQSPEDRYYESFDGTSADDVAKATKALELALDVRKFEIELYWKRATYFWAFTGAAFAGYLTVHTAKDIQNRAEALLLVSGLGLVFAVAWYFVNRASKFWQVNWEAHVDVLEDKLMGPIYKTVLQDSSNFWKLSASYPFSVTKINQLLSLFVVLVFVALVSNTLHDHYVITRNWELFPTACVVGTVVAVLVLYCFGKTGGTNRNVELHRRQTRISKYEAG
jgi:hypothetical protein